MSKPAKIHYGHYTLGRRALCGRVVKCDESLTRNERNVTCDQCHKALG